MRLRQEAPCFAFDLQLAALKLIVLAAAATVCALVAAFAQLTHGGRLRFLRHIQAQAVVVHLLLTRRVMYVERLTDGWPVGCI